jgi:proteasome assembly chaperone 2
MLIFETELGKLSGYTVLLPAVSVGNAGQLCLDVILENINRDKIQTCQVLHPSIVPVVGPDPLKVNNDSAAMSTALQAYVVPEQKLILFQIRSGILPGQGAAFIQQFLQWFQESDCKDLIIIGSMHSHERIDKQITGTAMRYLSTANQPRTVPEQFVQLEAREQNSEFELPSDNTTSTGPFIPGGGISSRVFQSCQEKSLPVTLLLKFCSEGDNRIDGLALCEYVNAYLNIIPQYSAQKSKIPASWKYLFGTSAPVQMFW